MTSRIFLRYSGGDITSLNQHIESAIISPG